jgi:hypothetical protein
MLLSTTPARAADEIEQLLCHVRTISGFATDNFLLQPALEKMKILKSALLRDSVGG